MWVILLEALGALAVLCAIVWWTMFSGRRQGERRIDEGQAERSLEGKGNGNGNGNGKVDPPA